MEDKVKETHQAKTLLEQRKRRRETIVILGLMVLFLVLTWFEFNLFTISKKLPIVHSVFFFGLVNFNIIILLTLLFLIFRNIVKAFVEKKGRFLGGSLKSKLVIAFLSFSVIPTILMFLISVFYINNSFDKWFSIKMSSVLRSSLEVSNEFFSSEKKKNYHLAQKIKQKIKSLDKRDRIYQIIQNSQEEFLLDSVEYYDERESFKAFSEQRALPNFPKVEDSFLYKGLETRAESSTIQYFSKGSLVRIIEPVETKVGLGAIVISTFIPLSLVNKMDDITEAYEDFRDVNPIEYPLKSIYLIVLIMMTMVIILAASWFGFYLARRLSVPLMLLSKATKRISKHNFEKVYAESGSQEVDELVKHFNTMTEELALSEKEIKIASDNLSETLNQLDERNRYMKVILSNINTGVIAVDQEGKIASVNKHAEELLGIKGKQFVGLSVRKVLNDSYYGNFFSMLKIMKEHKATFLQKELQIPIKGRSVPVQMSLSLLQDEKGKHLGQVLVFDDLSMMVNAQRAAAWREVARRIAHEIKNPLTPIKLSAQRLKKKFVNQLEKDSADFIETTDIIINEVDGLKDLVNEFSQFARMPESRPVFGNINQVITESLSLFRVAHKKIEFQLDISEKVPSFDFDPDQIRRVLSNLLDNSVTAVAEEKEPVIKVQTDFNEKLEIVKVSISDNGMGASEPALERLFEPYFSTKESGSGLGLSIVKRIVEDHNGFIRVLRNKKIGCGLEVVLELPVVDKKDSIIADSGQGLIEI